MSKHKLNTAESEFGRRQFLRRSAISGLGAGLMLNAPSAGAVSVPLECEPSASDSLFLYIDLLGKIQSEAFSDAASKITSAARDCYQTLDSLYQKLDLLIVELKGRRVRAHAEQMRNAVELGKAQIELIRTLPSSGQSAWAALGATLGMVESQVTSRAQDLLPSGRIVLTPKAKELLEEITTLVRDFRSVPESTKKATDAHQDRVAEISSLTSQIRDLLFAASSDAAEADLSANPALAQQAKLRAAKNIDDACAKLEQLRVPANKARQSELTSVDLLVKVLQGTKQSLGVLNAQFRRERGMQLLPASFDASLPVPDSNYSRVQQALDRHCPRGTPFRTIKCASLLVGTRPIPDEATKFQIIAGLLVFFWCSGGDKVSLARALARL